MPMFDEIPVVVETSVVFEIFVVVGQFVIATRCICFHANQIQTATNVRGRGKADATEEIESLEFERKCTPKNTATHVPDYAYVLYGSISVLTDIVSARASQKIRELTRYGTVHSMKPVSFVNHA